MENLLVRIQELKAQQENILRRNGLYDRSLESIKKLRYDDLNYFSTLVIEEYRLEEALQCSLLKKTA